MKASEVIDTAWTMAGRKALGQALDGDSQGYALTRLNQLVDEWQSQSLYIPYTTEIVQTVSGSPITIGSGGVINVTRPNFTRDTTFFKINGVNYPIEWISEELFNQIRLKTINSFPIYGWYDDALPMGSLNFFPVPTNYELHLRIDAILPAFADYDTDYNIAVGYRNALVYTMCEIACEGVKDVPRDISKRAENARRIIKTNNLSPIPWPTAAISRGVFWNGWRRSDFLQGGG